MAKIHQNILLKGLSGAVGKSLLFKQYRGKTIVCKYPDMSGVKRSKSQKRNNQKFREAIVFARGVMADEGLRREYRKQLKKGQTLYHFLIGVFMRR